MKKCLILVLETSLNSSYAKPINPLRKTSFFFFSFNLKNSFHHSLKINQSKQSCSRLEQCPRVCTYGRFLLHKNQCIFFWNNIPFCSPLPNPLFKKKKGKTKIQFKEEKNRSSNNKISILFVNIPLSGYSKKIAPSKPLCTICLETKALCGVRDMTWHFAYRWESAPTAFSVWACIQLKERNQYLQKVIPSIPC